MKKGIGSHQSSQSMKDEWLTPLEIIKSLGYFDLDPCSPVVRPWVTAGKHFTTECDGLSLDWYKRVWMNPPYGSQTGRWLSKLADHGHGTALIFARTETKMFFEYVWERASAVFFLKGRIHFYHVDGSRAKMNAGAPSVLVAYGIQDSIALKECGLGGKYIRLNSY